MRTFRRSRAFGAILVALALIAAACAEESGGGAKDEMPITVASFNFPESVILAEVYAQALEADGYSVERRLNLGSRELIFPELEAGNVDLLPEYVGSSLVVGFALDAPSDLSSAVSDLRTAFADLNMQVLDAAPGEDKNVFVVTKAFADANGVASVSDLSGAGDITLGGPPECENRSTCYQGLVETYGLPNVAFESIQEGSARVAALESGEIELSLLFSTQPVITEKGFVALEDDEGLIAPENIIPILSDEVADAFGADLTSLLNSVSAKITTDALLELNGKVELEGQSEADVAKEWLDRNGFLN